MRREWSVALAIGALGAALAVLAPSYFSVENLRDLLLVNMPVLVVATGAHLVMLSGEIDVSVGSVFAVCSVLAGVVAKAGIPVALVALVSCAAGASIGAVSGALVAYGRMPAIVVTLAAMVALRDGLRWVTQGAWIQNLPPAFQWLGFSQSTFPILVGGVVATTVSAIAWAMRHTGGGRTIYATGSNVEAARLAGIDAALVKLAVFTLGGALTGLAALLNSTRFNQIPSNTGLGLEMKVIAAVVVGGTAITGGRGTCTGTVLGVALLGTIGPALTYLGVSAQWERAVQGTIILGAVTIDALRTRRAAHTRRAAAAPPARVVRV